MTCSPLSRGALSRARALTATASIETLNELLDQLGALPRREDQLTVLGAWLARSKQAWDAERIQEQREILGKLGGG